MSASRQPGVRQTTTVEGSTIGGGVKIVNNYVSIPGLLFVLLFAQHSGSFVPPVVTTSAAPGPVAAAAPSTSKASERARRVAAPGRAPTRRGGSERTPSAPASTALAAATFAKPVSTALLSPPAEWPDGKSALCQDGWFSASRHRSGTCSSHGGVAHWRYERDDPYWRFQGEA